MRKFLRICIAALGLGLGCALTALVLYNIKYPGYGYVMRYTTMTPVLVGIYAVVGISFGLIFYLYSPYIIDGVRRFFRATESWLHRTPAMDILFGVLGLMLGLLLAYLVSLAVHTISVPVLPEAISILLYIWFGYLGCRFGITRRADILKGARGGNDGVPQKIVDTSVIIDGRLYDVCKAGFLEGTLVIPSFVLKELRHIADSSDVMKRNRGRRGLDLIKTMQETLRQPVIVEERDYDDVDEVDLKLLRLAADLGGVLVTNDYNLNKVAAVQNVRVLNINDLANAVKPVLLPGEELTLAIVKEGKEAGQGVGYLPDGTMVIVDNARRCIGEERRLVVTSALQTSAGRMIFAKLK